MLTLLFREKEYLKYKVKAEIVKPLVIPGFYDTKYYVIENLKATYDN